MTELMIRPEIKWNTTRDVSCFWLRDVYQLRMVPTLDGSTVKSS